MNLRTEWPITSVLNFARKSMPEQYNVSLILISKSYSVLGIWQKKESILEQAENKLNELAKLEESRRQNYTNTLIGLVLSPDSLPGSSKSQNRGSQFFGRFENYQILATSANRKQQTNSVK